MVVKFIGGSSNKEVTLWWKGKCFIKNFLEFTIFETSKTSSLSPFLSAIQLTNETMLHDS